MTYEDFEQVFASALAELEDGCNHHVDAATRPFVDLELDSFALLEVITTVEAALGASISVDDIAEGLTLRALYDRVAGAR